ncbi:MAG: metallophosphoesterase [Alkalimonas sp.]|nr:metallophosphoesterase [Alkalimonas sp.]
MSCYSFKLKNQVRIAQLSDCHLLADPAGMYQGIQPYHSLAAVLAALQYSDLDALILTGDLTQDHSQASYQHYLTLLAAFRIPVFWLPGNHDDSQLMSDLFHQAPFRPEKQLLAAGWQLLLLDSTGPTPAGYFPAERVQQLQHQLIESQQPSWLFTHHHPAPIGSSIDRHGWQDSEPFWQLLMQHEQVQGIAHGHCHHAYLRQLHGKNVVGCPATSVQFQQTSDWQTVASVSQWCEWTFRNDGSFSVDFKRMMP